MGDAAPSICGGRPPRRTAPLRNRCPLVEDHSKDDEGGRATRRQETSQEPHPSLREGWGTQTARRTMTADGLRCAKHLRRAQHAAPLRNRCPLVADHSKDDRGRWATQRQETLQEPHPSLREGWGTQPTRWFAAAGDLFFWSEAQDVSGVRNYVDGAVGALLHAANALCQIYEQMLLGDDAISVQNETYQKLSV
jgi:hypothetical protein